MLTLPRIVTSRDGSSRRRVRRLVAWTGSAVALGLIFAGGMVLGSRTIIVSGPSMEPTMHTGDVMLVWPRPSYEIGDVVVYRVPEDLPGAGALVVHRIVDHEADRLVLRGDNNDEIDPWKPQTDDVVGRQLLLIPRLGLIISLLRQPAVLAALVAGFVTARLVASLDREPVTAARGSETSYGPG